jgi:ribonuclease Y
MIWMASVEWLAPAAGLGVGLLAGFLLWRMADIRSRRAFSTQKQELLDRARREAETLSREERVSAEEQILKRQREAESELSRKRLDAEGVENRLHQREAVLQLQTSHLAERERSLAEQRASIERREAEIATQRAEAEALLARRREELAGIARLSEAEARTALQRQIEQETMKDAADLSRHLLESARTRAEEEARRIIATAIQRYAGEHTFETSTATVSLNGHDIKGRIIGREGRNIRSFEAATGVTVLIDDTPGTVVLSGFDPVRREVAKQAMERLIQDGRIHPGRIEEVVKKVQGEIEETILRLGEEAVFKVGLPPMHTEIVRLLGRLRFRCSYSQNILDHSLEVAHLAGLMAGELGADPVIARRAGLLHDIGKAITHEVEGTHAQIGADFLRRYGESPAVVEAVAAHHDEQPHSSVHSLLVSAADAISASRPGARSESMTTYLKRLEDLERVGTGFPGVEKCYAVQAGREVRVFVNPESVSDEEAFALARSIARKVEDELLYPGQIRVIVLRETRCIEFAK